MNNMSVSRARSYALTFRGLFAVFLLLRRIDWAGSRELHTLMEVMATLLALMVGVLGLARYHTTRSCSLARRRGWRSSRRSGTGGVSARSCS